MATALKPLPPRDAIAALFARGGRLEPSFAWQDVWQDIHATEFTVAKSAGFDILGDIFDGVMEHLAKGKTLQSFVGELTPVLQAKGWWGKQPAFDPVSGETRWSQLGSVRRLQTIFDVNMRVSYAAGHWASFERNKATRPFLRYVHLENQENPRLLHHLWHNTVLPVDHPWWNTHACPNGWNCHCTLQALSQRDIDRLQREGEVLKFEAPVIETVLYVNKRTGQTLYVPKGIDPGWAYNPGKAGHRAATQSAFAEKVATGEFELARAAIDETTASPAFEEFIRRPEGAMPVMKLSSALSSALGTDATGVILSAETMVKQLRNHPELTLDDYRLLPRLAEAATIAVQDGDNTIVLIQEDAGRWRHVAIKATRSRKAAFLTSYRFTGPDDVRRLLAKGGVKILFDRR